MSLWPVSDDATQCLMTEFYHQWLNGETKHKSPELAKKKVKETPGWEDPEYWAAFVLLDGVEKP